MDIDQLLILFAVCAATYFAGYHTLAIGLAMITGIIMLIGGAKKSKPPQVVPVGGVRVRGAEMLEPIIIESTRGPPFRIPKDMDIRINPTWAATNLIEKATMQGAASLARLVHRLIWGRYD